MPDDVATAIVSERSQELLRATYLSYFGILGVMNDIRRTIPILSVTHAREFGYMLTDLNKYYQGLRRVSSELGMTVNQTRQLGLEAKKSGADQQSVLSVYARVSELISRRMQGPQQFAEYRRFAEQMGILGVRGLENMRPEQQGRRATMAIADYYLRARRVEGQRKATDFVSAMQESGINVDPYMLERLARTAGTPEGLRLRAEQQRRASQYEKEQQAAAAKGTEYYKQWKAGRPEEEKTGFDPAIIAKIEIFNDKLGKLGEQVDILRQKMTNLFTSLNIDYIVHVIEMITNVIKKLNDSSDVIESIVMRYKKFFQLPWVGFITMILKWVALATLFGVVMPKALQAVAMWFGVSGTAAEAFGGKSKTVLTMLFSPLHQLGSMAKWVSERFALMFSEQITLQLTQEASLLGKMGGVISVLASSAWKAVLVIGAMAKAWLAEAVAQAMALAELMTILVVITSVIDAFRILYIAITKHSLEAFKNFKMLPVLIVDSVKGMFGLNSATVAATDNIVKMGQAGAELGAKTNMSLDQVLIRFKMIKEQDLFGAIFSQILNLPERIIPRAMELIQFQLKTSKDQLMPVMLGQVTIRDQQEIMISHKDIAGSALQHYVNTRP
jgi:hypothetical protein